jgi:hypothetical protein
MPPDYVPPAPPESAPATPRAGVLPQAVVDQFRQEFAKSFLPSTHGEDPSDSPLTVKATDSPGLAISEDLKTSLVSTGSLLDLAKQVAGLSHTYRTFPMHGDQSDVAEQLHKQLKAELQATREAALRALGTACALNQWRLNDQAK